MSDRACSFCKKNSRLLLFIAIFLQISRKRFKLFLKVQEATTQRRLIMTQIIEGKRYETKTLSIGSTIQGGWLKTIHADMIENISPDINRLPVKDRKEIAEVLSTIEDSEWFVIAGDGRQVKIFTMSQVPQGEIVLKAGLKSWYDEQLACVMVAVLASDSF